MLIKWNLKRRSNCRYLFYETHDWIPEQKILFLISVYCRKTSCNHLSLLHGVIIPLSENDGDTSFETKII